MKPLFLALRGFIIGMCDIIPGVSGGTMAFLLGIYDELIHSIRNFNLFWIWDHIQYMRTKNAEHKKRRNKHFEELNLPFLIPLGIGIVVAVLSLAGLLTFLLDTYANMTFAFFSGLIFASAIVLFRHNRGFTSTRILFLLAGFFGGFLFGIVNFLQLGSNPLWLILAGFLAATAMLLPGVSGSYVLLLVGKYEDVLQAVHTMDIYPLLFLVIGIAIGIYLMSHVIDYLLRNVHQPTIFFLTGLIVGSLAVLIRLVDTWNLITLLWFIVGVSLPFCLDVLHAGKKLS